jgi:hypothetical protein
MIDLISTRAKPLPAGSAVTVTTEIDAPTRLS